MNKYKEMSQIQNISWFQGYLLVLLIIDLNETVDLVLLATHSCEPITSLDSKYSIFAAFVDHLAVHCAIDNIAFECIGVPYIKSHVVERN